jgi:hypothetical protein
MGRAEGHSSRSERTVLLAVLVVASCARPAEADLPQGGRATPSDQDTTLRAVRGGDPASVFAAGADGRALRYDSTAWSPVTSGADAYLYGVRGSAPSDVFAAGWSGTIVHYDGSVWLPPSSGARYAVGTLQDSGLRDDFAVGDGGTIRRCATAASAAGTSHGQGFWGWWLGAASVALSCGLCWLALARLKRRRGAIAKRKGRSGRRMRRRTMEPDDLSWLVGLSGSGKRSTSSR